MARRKTRRERGRTRAEFRAPSRSSEVIHFYSGSFSLDPAEFEHVGDADEPAAIAKRALVMVEGSHTDSKKRKHVFDKERILRFAANTNAFLEQGGRVPWQTDHAKTQGANLGDLEGELYPEMITAENLPNPKLKHLIGKLGLFTDELIARGKTAVQDVLDGKIKTLSPGIDLATDTIREISATPTPAIVGLSTFKRAEAAEREAIARFALTMQEAEAEDQDYNAMKEEFEELSERFWRVVSDIGNAPPEEFEGEDPVNYLEQAISDYVAAIQEMLQLNEQPEPGQDPRLQQQQQAPGVGAAPTQPQFPQQQRRFSMADNLSYYTMGDVLGIAEFARPKGAKDKKPRKRRGAMIAGGAAAAGGLTAAGRYGTAAVGEMRRTQGGLRAGARGANQALRRDVGRVKGAAKRGYRDARSMYRNTANATRQGFRGGAQEASKTVMSGGVQGKVRKGAAGLKGAAKGALSTRGGKLGLAAAGVGAAGTGAAALLRRRKKNRRS